MKASFLKVLFIYSLISTICEPSYAAIYGRHVQGTATAAVVGEVIGS